MIEEKIDEYPQQTIVLNFGVDVSPLLTSAMLFEETDFTLNLEG